MEKLKVGILGGAGCIGKKPGPILWGGREVVTHGALVSLSLNENPLSAWSSIFSKNLPVIS